IFAPSQEAWATAGIMVGMASTGTLAEVLRAHTVEGQVLIADLTDGQVLTTLNGTVSVDITGTEVSLVDGAGHRAVIDADRSDVRTLTGAVHVVDGLLGL